VNYLPLYASLGELQIEFTLFSASQFNKFKGKTFLKCLLQVCYLTGSKPLLSLLKL